LGTRDELENPIVGDSGPDTALDLVESRAFPKGRTLQVYRPAGRPEYAT